MKVRVRAKQDGGLSVFDENGDAIEGLVQAELEACGLGQVPVVRLTIRGPEVVVDAEEKVEEKKPKGRFFHGDKDSDKA